MSDKPGSPKLKPGALYPDPPSYQDSDEDDPDLLEFEEEEDGQLSSLVSPKEEEPEVTHVFKHVSKGRKSGSSSSSSSNPSQLNINILKAEPKESEGEEDLEGEDEELRLLDQAFGDEEEEDDVDGSNRDEWTIHEDTEYETEADSEDEDHSSAVQAWLDNKSTKLLADNRSKFNLSETAVEEVQSSVGTGEDKLDESELNVIASSDDEAAQLLTIPETPAKHALSKQAELEADCTNDLVDPITNYKNLSSDAEEYVSKTEPRMNRCPSIESYFRMSRIVDVHFYLFPGKKMISRDCRIDSTIYQLKMAISRFVRVPPDRLDLRRKKSLVADNKTLEDIGARGGKKIKFLVEINHILPGKMELHIMGDRGFKLKADAQRTVAIDAGIDSVPTEVGVLIEYPKEPKPNLGGFVDQRKCTMFNHASTEPELFDDKEWQKSDLHQACQTYTGEAEYSQTVSEKAIQMDREDYYISQDGDFIIHPKPYRSFDLLEEKRAAAAVIVQRYWRRWLGIKERKRRLEGLVMRVDWAEQIRKGRLAQRMAIMKEELARQQNPTSLLDLELLYRAINAWREGEEEYVKANRWGAERKAALACLTEMEADLLLELERTKLRIVENGREDNMHRKFIKMSEPKRWLGTKSGSFISYDTGGRVKARRLHEIYKSLLAPVPNSLEGFKKRVELLENVSALVSEKPSRKSDMIQDLISRELRFLNVKASSTLLSGVRRRIVSTFFCLCKDPKFNDEAQRIEKIPWESEKLRKDMVQCKGCRRMQYRDEFTIVKGTTLTSRCHTCMGLYRTAILRVDLNLYRQMLKELRRDEFQAGVVNSGSFLIDAFDMRFLVEQIWHGQSALSGIDNRYLLRLCRWVKTEPWAPWNCVLLTEEEAVAHIQLDDLESAYQETFFHKVFVKQATAKTYFEGLAKVAVGVDDRIAENCRNAAVRQEKVAHLKSRWQKKMRTIDAVATLASRVSF